MTSWNRRQFLGTAAITLAAAASRAASTAPAACGLGISTYGLQSMDLESAVSLIAETGYDCLEIAAMEKLTGEPANAVLRRPTTIADVRVAGIRNVTLADLRAAEARGERYVLLGSAVPAGDDWSLTVEPTPLPNAHPLARMSGDEMGVVYHTDISGIISAAVLETDAMPTAAAMLRDVVGF